MAFVRYTQTLNGRVATGYLDAAARMRTANAFPNHFITGYWN